MDAGYVTAVAGLAGALIGSLANVVTTWATHSSQLRDKHQGADDARKQKLFGDFIAEASRLYADALSHEKDDATDLVGLYALVGNAPGCTRVGRNRGGGCAKGDRRDLSRAQSHAS